MKSGVWERDEIQNTVEKQTNFITQSSGPHFEDDMGRWHATGKMALDRSEQIVAPSDVPGLSALLLLLVRRRNFTPSKGFTGF